MSEYASWADANLDVRQRSGDEWLCICIFHSDTNPSMRVNVKKGLFYCHACGKGGHLNGVMGVAKDIKGLDIGALKDRIDSAQPWYSDKPALNEAMLKKFATPHDYLEGRGFGTPTRVKWDLGYDPLKNAITIPYRDLDGSLRGIIRRYLDPDIKSRYRYPSGCKISEILFGSWRARSDQPLFICEGSLDAVTLNMVGLNAVAVLGSQMSDWQLEVIRQIGAPNIVLMMDNDRQGRESTADFNVKLRHKEWVLSLQEVEGRAYGKKRDGNGKAKDPGDMTWESLEMVARKYG